MVRVRALRVLLKMSEIFACLDVALSFVADSLKYGAKQAATLMLVP